MVELGIPVYKAKDTLPMALDSLVVQTKKNFIVCLSIDGDGEDYSDIISAYRACGLKIRVINSKENRGPGMARQEVINTTICDYIMFLDADDILMPRAVEVLYTNAKAADYDILQGSFIRENRKSNDIVMSSSDNVITWFHGKIYKVNFLKEKKINFINIRTDEDAYFNAVAWNSTENKGIIDEVVYLWRDNKFSTTRQKSTKEYFLSTFNNYIYSQVEALKTLFKINDSVSQLLITNTLINIYYFYMKAVFYKCDMTHTDEIVSTLKDEKWMQLWLNEGTNWMDVVTNIKAGQIYDDEYVVFYEETFNLWAARLLKE